MPQDELKGAGERLSKKVPSQLAMRWEAVDKLAVRVRRHLRPLYEALEPASMEPENPWLAALMWMKNVFASSSACRNDRPMSARHRSTPSPSGYAPT